MTARLFRTAAPLFRAITETGQWRWYQPDSEYSAPPDELVGRVIEHFRDPKPLDSFPVDGQSEELVRNTISRLTAAGFLRESLEKEPNGLADLAPADQVELTPSTPTLFNAPRLEYEATPDAVVLGVRYAGGSPEPDVAHGPALLRGLASSFVYQIDEHENPIGFFDLARRRPVLEGMRLADAGDYMPPAGDSKFFDVASAIGAACGEVWPEEGILITIGGDHSITWPILTSAPALAYQVIQLDAHLDLDGSVEGHIDHANVMSAVCRLPAVKKVIQVGVRGYDDRRFERYLQSYTGKLVSASAATIAEHLDPEVPCYVTLDVDCLDASISPGTHHISPGGLTFHEIRELLEFVGGAAPALGIDIVELSPARDVRGITGHTALMCLLSYLDGWWRAGKRRAPSRP